MEKSHRMLDRFSANESKAKIALPIPTYLDRVPIARSLSHVACFASDKGSCVPEDVFPHCVPLFFGDCCASFDGSNRVVGVLSVKDSVASVSCDCCAAKEGSALRVDCDRRALVRLQHQQNK